MIYLEDLPNELILSLFSYLTKFELLKSFLKLNIRFNILLSNYIHHINLSSILTKNQIDKYSKNYFPYINNDIYSLTFDNYEIGKYFLEKIKFIQLENLYKIKLIDNGIDLQDGLFEIFKPNILNLVITSLSQEKKRWKFSSTSIKQLQIELQTGDIAKNFLTNQFDVLSTSILVDIRITCSKLSEYFQLFNCQFSIHIHKLCVSIFSIDKTDYHHLSILPYLNEFQLEICQIPFYLIQFLIPSNENLKRFAFIGQTTTINAKSWKILLEKYISLEQFHLYLSNNKSIDLFDIEEWKYEFPKYLVKYNSLNNSFQICSSKFDIFDRLYLNESIEHLNHIEYPNKIVHLIIRSQYWCSYFDLSLNIQNELITRFHRIKRLSTTYRQLEYFLKSSFLNQIQQLDLEFLENYCVIQSDIAEKFLNLKSISLSSIYDGIHELQLHTIIKDILLNKLSNIIYITIDAIQIIDDEHVENSISQWYLLQNNQPIINYIPGKSLSIWF
ncbi:unnamed protein product [Adineta steineri]|uniref:F-box domain-containing protein n=1 Tax=Adineta steineri TaxID=433720 RepID=A0A813VXZ5_9BILA|nr:unnamed protein product [Adineta steineri]CAF3513525.1 unnamed protein product [Adineta steineri]